VLHVCRHYRWLHSYAVLFCHQHCRPPFVRIAEPRCYALPSYIPAFSVSAAMTAGYIRTRRSPATIIANIRSEALPNFVGMYRCPTFVRAACLPSASLTYVRTHCRTPSVRTTVRHLYVLHICHHYGCPTFVRTARPPSTLPTYVRTHCRTSLVHTAVRHFYILRVCRYYHWLHSYALLVCCQDRRTLFIRIPEPRLYVPLS